MYRMQICCTARGGKYDGARKTMSGELRHPFGQAFSVVIQRRLKGISNSVDGPDHFRAELVPERLDVGIYRTGTGCIYPVPYFFKEFFACQHLLGFTPQSGQKVELCRGQVDLFSAEYDKPLRGVNYQAREFKDLFIL